MAAARDGRLYTKQSGEGGADQIYDGASKSAFEDAMHGKHSATWEAKAERFKVEQMAPDVDVHVAGIADTAKSGKPTATWAAQKPRFEETKAVGGDYNVATSDFDKAAKASRPTPNMATPTKGGARSDAWLTSNDQVASPAPAPIPGAFDEKLKKNTPSAYAQTGGDRFKDLYTVSSHGEPAATSSAGSDFDKAARNTKPSPAAIQGGDRFKASYDIPSYGDPGASASTADIERHALEQKIARQKGQAEAERNRVLHE